MTSNEIATAKEKFGLLVEEQLERIEMIKQQQKFSSCWDKTLVYEFCFCKNETTPNIFIF